ncbi:MAG: SpaH/EbpB family LPXTG-anchored major pilin [Ruthenibacterium sp.]
MNFCKRFASLLVAALVMLSLSAPAFAASPLGSVTMKDTAGNVKVNSTYEAYQIVTWNMSELDGQFLYTDMVLNAAYRNAIIGEIGAPLSAASTDAEILKAIADLNETTQAGKIAALAVALSKVTRPADYTAASGVFSNLPYGYYLIRETANNATDGTVLSKPILVSVPDRAAGNPAISVTVKTSTATIDKDIVLGEGPTATTAKSAEKKIGDTVNFKLSATIPSYAADATGIVYSITDLLSKGLSFTADSVVVKAANGSVIPALDHYTVTTAAPDSEGNLALKIDFVYDKIKDAGALSISYSAVLNTSAIIGSQGNRNSVSLTYSNQPGVNTYTTPQEHTVVYTTGIELTKLAKGELSNLKLEGATFGLYSDPACTKPARFYTYKLITDKDGHTVISTELIPGDAAGTVTSDFNGVVHFTGLIAGTYYIKETKAPAGYNLLKDVIVLTVSVKLPPAIHTGLESAQWTTTNTSFDNKGGIFHADIMNTKGFQLPGTGGMGTTLFTLGGASLLAVAGGLFVYYRKKNRA